MAPEDHDELLETINNWGKCIPSLKRIYIQDAYDDDDIYDIGSEFYDGRVASFDLDSGCNKWKDSSHRVLGFPGSHKISPYYRKTSEIDEDVLDSDSEDF